jgi:hypothetical protein
VNEAAAEEGGHGFAGGWAIDNLLNELGGKVKPPRVPGPCYLNHSPVWFAHFTDR